MEKDKLDRHDFFLKLEWDARRFLQWMEWKQKGNHALYPSKMMLLEWWKRYEEWCAADKPAAPKKDKESEAA